MLKQKALEDLKEALNKKVKRDSDINVISIQRLKSLFKQNPVLKQIPPQHRTEFIPHMHYIQVQTLDTFISQSTKKPDFYFVIKGRFQHSARSKQSRILQIYDVFGYTKPLNNKDWQISRVIARQPSALITISRANLKKGVLKIRKYQQNIKLLGFLVQTVPGVRQLGQAGKEKVLSFFQLCQFKVGDILLREKVKSGFAFVIYQGECKLYCSEDPLKRPGSAPVRGLMSKTTSCYNFGLINSGEWIGQDSILTDKPMTYSARATTAVKALKISKDRFMENLAKETLQTLKTRLEKKKNWMTQRKNNISHTIQTTIYNSEASNQQATFEHTEKLYPTASRAAVLNIRRNQLVRTEYNSKVLLALPNARQSPTREQISSKKSLQRQENPYQFRPSTSQAKFLKRPMSSTNLLKKNFQSTNLFIKQLEDQNKTMLHSACTLGRFLVPTITKEKPKPSEFLILGTVQRKEEIKQLPKPRSYAELVRQGRPPSPNPAEVWARKNSIFLHNF